SEGEAHASSRIDRPGHRPLAVRLRQWFVAAECDQDQGPVERADPASQARRIQPGSRAETRDLRRRLYLQTGDRRWVRRDLEEPRYVDGALRLRQRCS